MLSINTNIVFLN